ncbi:hypothetical protein J2S08_001958 [Bacillus chungangensis]|uniref:GntR family transcriptional regulator n=1 Tax=Bacillus chungangensis TaxID=587633 RepID=A0ABT9WS41_9BACI|nr:hypothetical protein [Bacillus chungangensis]
MAALQGRFVIAAFANSPPQVFNYFYIKAVLFEGGTK